MAIDDFLYNDDWDEYAYDEPPKDIEREVDLFNECGGNASLGRTDEYIVLYIDDIEITSGEIEVLQRIKQINRENGNYDF